jgi:hypothetical protein
MNFHTKFHDPSNNGCLSLKRKLNAHFVRPPCSTEIFPEETFILFEDLLSQTTSGPYIKWR